MHLLFVYGTLKKGFENEHMMDHPQCRLLHNAVRTKETYPLFVCERTKIPYIVQKPKHGKHILGELYECSDDHLVELDIFEEVPDDYQRITIQVELMEDQEYRLQENAIIYMYAKTVNEHKDEEIVRQESFLSEYTHKHNAEYAKLNGNYVPSSMEK